MPSYTVRAWHCKVSSAGGRIAYTFLRFALTLPVTLDLQSPAFWVLDINPLWPHARMMQGRTNLHSCETAVVFAASWVLLDCRRDYHLCSADLCPCPSLLIGRVLIRYSSCDPKSACTLEITSKGVPGGGISRSAALHRGTNYDLVSPGHGTVIPAFARGRLTMGLAVIISDALSPTSNHLDPGNIHPTTTTHRTKGVMLCAFKRVRGRWGGVSSERISGTFE